MESPESPKYTWEIEGPKPPFPYIPGFSTKIRLSTVPSEAEKKTQTDAETSLRDRYPPGTHRIPAIEYCIAKQSFELETEQGAEISHQTKDHTLHVDSIISRPTGDISWNMVQCHLDNDRNSRCTAEIYDPVYSYDVSTHCILSSVINSRADAFAAVHEAGISGKVTPVFLGVWVMDVPVPSKEYGGVDFVATRSVPLFLFEHIEAANLASTYLRRFYTSGYVESQALLPQAWRLEVLAEIYEAMALLCHAGICPDVHPDSVFVGTTILSDGKLNVKVIIPSFTLTSFSTDGKQTGKPASPIETFWKEVLYDLNHLTWDEWGQEENATSYRQWLVQRWGESTEYRPLPEDLRRRIAAGEWELSD